MLSPTAPIESYLDAAARQIGTDTTNDFVFGPLHEALRQRLFDGLKARLAGGTVLTGIVHDSAVELLARTAYSLDVRS